MLTQVIRILRCLVFAFSFYGYFQLARKKVAAEIAPALVMCSIASVMFVAGILNFLREAAVAVCVFGAALAVRSIVRRERVRDLLTPGTLIFLAFCVYFGVLLYGARVSHFDNFSEWVLAPDIMVRKNRFPSFQDKVFYFKAYPLGSASFIYYFVKIIGIPEEWMMMYAQAVFIFAMATTLFAFARGWPGCLLALASSVILIAGDINLTELLVDTLLPLTALASMAACVSAEDELEKNLWITIPFSLSLISIKNSGVFFTVILLCFVFFRTCRSFRKNLRMWAVIVLSPFALLLCWQRHVDLVFPGGMNTKHALSLGNFLTNYREKSAETISGIAGKMISTLFSGSNTILFLLIFLVVLGCISRFVLREKKDKGRCLSVCALICLSVYIVGIFLMYVFSMPTHEAKGLASFRRYYKTILIFVTGLVTIRVLLLIRGDRVRSGLRGWLPCLLAAVCGVSSFFAVAPDLSYYGKHETDERRVSLEHLVEEYDVPAGMGYLLACNPDEVFNKEYMLYFARYRLRSPRVAVATDEWLENNPDGWKNSDYIIVVEKSETNESYIRERFGYRDVIDLSQYREPAKE